MNKAGHSTSSDGETAIGRKRVAGGYDASPEMEAHDEQQALARVEKGLRVAKLVREELVGLICTEPRKVLLAELLWKKTTVSQAWIAEHLDMRNVANVSGVIHRMDFSQLQEKVSENLRRFVSDGMKGTLTPSSLVFLECTRLKYRRAT